MNPCIPVPSPDSIKSTLFPNGALSPVELPTAWNAVVLLTPFGGGNQQSGLVSDQLIVGDLSYQSLSSSERCMRCRLYLVEDFAYFDFFFRTSNGATQWWWLVSDPSDSSGMPTASYGPFDSTANIPVPDFLGSNRFTHAGSWNIHGKMHNAFSSRNAAQAGTWYFFDGIAGSLGRVMNVDNTNDFGVPILGADYLIEVSRFRTTSADLQEVYGRCPHSATPAAGPSPMLTQADVFKAMSAAPSGASQVQCSMARIEELLPGIAPASAAISTPTWTNQVNSNCFMIGQDIFPYYCQLWYDWQKGVQVTVFVFQDDSGAYTARQDERLPKGQVGPSVDYVWEGGVWNPSCYTANGGDVPMPVPDFVKAGGGRCRATITNHPVWGTVSIWTVQLGGGGSWADFWFWFDDKQRGVIFSLAPASSLTIIDYQSFVQDGGIQTCVFDDPSGSIAACPENRLALRKRMKRKFLPK
jgi:hypothetical protein